MGTDADPERVRQRVLLTAERCLRESPQLAEHPVYCEFHGGTLTLCGRVPAYSLKQLARSLVQRIDGVKAVDNQLDVVPLPAFDAPSGRHRRAERNDPHRSD